MKKRLAFFAVLASILVSFAGVGLARKKEGPVPIGWKTHIEPGICAITRVSGDVEYGFVGIGRDPKAFGNGCATQYDYFIIFTNKWAGFQPKETFQVALGRGTIKVGAINASALNKATFLLGEDNRGVLTNIWRNSPTEFTPKTGRHAPVTVSMTVKENDMAYSWMRTCSMPRK